MLNLKILSTLPPEGTSKNDYKQKLKETRQELYELQNKFYADGRYSLLIVLQGLDASGKDGTIRKAFRGINPQGINVTSFKKPSEKELRHDFLWRIYPHFPEKGMIRVFNRSHYEDIIVPTVNDSLSKDVLAHRMKVINGLEKHLEMSNTKVLKFFLHITPEEQKERIEERKKKPHKKWKYDPSDEKIPLKWDEHEEAYQQVLNNCNEIPWQIIPSDKKWYRNYMVAEIVKKEIENLDLKYPGLNNKDDKAKDKN